MPILFGLISAFVRKIVEVATEVRDADARVYSLVQWGIAAIKVVQAFTKEEAEHRPLYGRQPRKPAGDIAALQLADALYSGAGQRSSSLAARRSWFMPAHEPSCPARCLSGS